MTNTFYHGDCKFVMRHDIEPNSIDLIYLDPPFFTGKVQKGKWQPGAMEVSYDDSKKFWGDTIRCKAAREQSPQWLQHIAKSKPDFASYLWYMMERLKLCHGLLRDTGSIYLHCDYRASHYLKMIMDEEPDLFGVGNFRNELVWFYPSMSAAHNYFPKKHDTIFYYSKSDKYTFNGDAVREAYDEKTIARYNNPVIFPGGYRAEINDKGRLPYSVWQVPPLRNVSKEKVGYPTQKPLVLLERIILASSNEGNTVLDPFCGCGTAIIAAHKLNRQWIGIDINHFAYETTKGREVQLPLLTQGEFSKAQYVSRDLDEVQQIEDGREFEQWVNQFYGATKPSPDRGVDGITENGIPIQTKIYEIKQKELSQFLNDVKYHHKVPQPAKEVIAVSKVGFDDSARKLQFAAETKEGIKIRLETPEKMLRLED